MESGAGNSSGRILKWVAIPFSRGSSQSRVWTWVSCITDKCFTVWASREAPLEYIQSFSLLLCIWMYKRQIHTVQFNSIQSLSHVRLWDPMDCSMPGLPVHHQLPEFTQTHVHWVSDTIQPSHPIVPFSFRLQSFPALESFALNQVSSLHQVAKVLELQHQFFQWIFRIFL